MRVDYYHFWTLSLSWFESGEKPYLMNDSEQHRPLLAFGKVERFDSEEQAWEMKRRFEADRSWAPKGAIDPYVSGPSKVKRDKPLEAAA
jgi:hypothetical protein